MYHIPGDLQFEGGLEFVLALAGRVQINVDLAFKLIALAKRERQDIGWIIPPSIFPVPESGRFLAPGALFVIWFPTLLST